MAVKRPLRTGDEGGVRAVGFGRYTYRHSLDTWSVFTKQTKHFLRRVGTPPLADPPFPHHQSHSMVMLTVANVAHRLNVSLGCVYGLISSGKLPCHRIGLGRGAIRVREEDLDQYLASTRSEKGEEAPRLPRLRLKHLKI